VSATLLEHRGVTVELNWRSGLHFTPSGPRMLEGVVSEIETGWYVSHCDVGETFIGKFVNNSARDEAARLWVDLKMREGKL
jgi:hypothetical protein